MVEEKEGARREKTKEKNRNRKQIEGQRGVGWEGENKGEGGKSRGKTMWG